MPDLKEQLTRKIGPLPVWAWGGVVGGGVLIAKVLTGGGGASSPFVTPIAQSGDLNFDDISAGGSGGGGGGGSTTTPPPTTTPHPINSPGGGNASNFGRWLRRGLPPIVKRPPVTTPGKIIKPPVLHNPRAGTRYGFDEVFVPLRNGSGRGDTQGDTTPGTPLAMVPSQDPLPVGNVLALPIFGGNAVYSGPTISAQPIASSARVVMPSLSSPRGGGSVAVPVVVPASSGRPTWTRALDPLARVADRLTPDLPGTTARPRLAVADAVSERIDNIIGSNLSG